MLLAECLWDVDPCGLLSLGSDPVSSLLGLEDSVWASCANQVAVVQESSLHVQVDQSSLRSSFTCLSFLSNSGRWSDRSDSSE